MTPTLTGFAIRFSQSFDAALLNTSDANNALGPVDITLVGANVGNVLGTVVVNAGYDRFTFIKSGGLLAPDTYTVALRSAANGLATPGGALLDGNADGTTGDDFVGTFTQSALDASTVTVSVGDFIRGYGQTVNLPATTSSGIPISLSTGQNIGSADVALYYNPALLTIIGGASPISGATANIDFSTPGIVNITVTKASEFDSLAGSIVLANLVATVPENAAYAAKEILDLTANSIHSTSGGALPTADDDGLHIAGYRGDLNGDRAIGTGDVTLALRLQSCVLSTSGFTAFQLADSYFVSDMNDDGTATTGDVTGLLRFQSGAAGGFPRIPAVPSGLGAPPAGGPDPQIFIPTSGLSGSVGQVITVPVKLNVTEAAGIDLAGVRVNFTYDSTRFAISNVRFGSAIAGLGFSSSFNTATAGFASLVAAVDLGSHFTQGFLGDLFLFDLTVKAGAAAGTSAINLLAATGGTDNSTLNLTIFPEISNGEDVNDGAITVVEPSYTITPLSGLITTEAGGTATFTVRLNSQPTADVTIGLASSNTAEGTVSPASLTFTTANWNMPHTVTLTGVDDFVDDEDVPYTIVTAPATSVDATYDGLDPADVSATNKDYETNHPPSGVLLSNSAVLENITGKTIGNLSAVDADTADTHTYFVSDSRFVITGNLLALAPGVSLNRSSDTSVALAVTARDSGTPPFEYTTTLDITVLANPFPWQNQLNHLDAAHDGRVTARDSLAIINEVNRPTVGNAAGRLPGTRPANSTLAYLDPSGDGFVSARDALLIINLINEEGAAAGEGEPSDEIQVMAGLFPLVETHRTHFRIPDSNADFARSLAGLNDDRGNASVSAELRFDHRSDSSEQVDRGQRSAVGE